MRTLLGLAGPVAIAFAGVVGLAQSALAQVYNFTITPSGATPSSMSATFNGNAAFSGTLIGNYVQATNPTGTRTFNLIIFGTRPAAPTNLTKTLSGTGTSSGNAAGVPVGTYRLTVAGNQVTLSDLTTNLMGAATPPTAPVNASVTYQSFSTAAPNNDYPFLTAIPVPLGTASVIGMNVAQTADASGPLTPAGGGRSTFSLSVPASITATIDFQGATTTQTQEQTVTITGSITPAGASATASLMIALNITSDDTTPAPQPVTPFDLPPLTGTGDPAHLLLTLTINSQHTNVTGTTTLPGAGVVVPPTCSTADFDGDGDSGTDADIEAFFACLAGTCCPTCYPGGADFNADGDSGTDADIESFFRVLSGGVC